MTTTIEDLDWVTFLDEGQDQEKSCENGTFGCSNAAVFVVRWGPDPAFSPAEDRCNNTCLLCLPCFEMYAHKPEGSGVYCNRCKSQTGRFLFKKVIYSEPVKR